MFARLIAGFRLLGSLNRQALARHLPGGEIVVHLIVLFAFGPLGLLLSLGLHALWLAWQLGGDVLPADREPAARPFRNPFTPHPADRNTRPIIGVFTMPRPVKVLLSLIGFGLLLWLFSPFAIVPAGSRGVVTTFGKVSPDVLGEGLHLIIPLAQTVHLVDVRIQKGEGMGDAASRDMQSVNTSVALNYHIDPKEAANVFRDIGLAVGERIIVPAVQEAVKAATAQYTAEELISKRPEVRDRIKGILVERLSRHGVVVDEFSIVNFSFSPSFNEAIEAKTTAEQLKLKAERDLERIRVEAEQKIAQAKAEAEALALQKQQVTPELIRLREIENQRKAIEKWDGKMPQVAGGALPFINVSPTGR